MKNVMGNSWSLITFEGYSRIRSLDTTSALWCWGGTWRLLAAGVLCCARSLACRWCSWTFGGLRFCHALVILELRCACGVWWWFPEGEWWVVWGLATTCFPLHWSSSDCLLKNSWNTLWIFFPRATRRGRPDRQQRVLNEAQPGACGQLRYLQESWRGCSQNKTGRHVRY